MHRNAEFILTNVSLKFTWYFPDFSQKLEQGKTVKIWENSPKCFLCSIHTPIDHQLKFMRQKYALSLLYASPTVPEFWSRVMLG